MRSSASLELDQGRALETLKFKPKPKGLQKHVKDNSAAMGREHLKSDRETVRIQLSILMS